MRGQKWPKIDPKPWTIVHGFDRFWAILKLSILLLRITQTIIILTLMEIGTFLEYSEVKTGVLVRGQK